MKVRFKTTVSFKVYFLVRSSISAAERMWDVHSRILSVQGSKKQAAKIKLSEAHYPL